MRGNRWHLTVRNLWLSIIVWWSVTKSFKTCLRYWYIINCVGRAGLVRERVKGCPLRSILTRSDAFVENSLDFPKSHCYRINHVTKNIHLTKQRWQNVLLYLLQDLGNTRYQWHNDIDIYTWERGTGDKVRMIISDKMLVVRDVPNINNIHIWWQNLFLECIFIKNVGHDPPNHTQHGTTTPIWDPDHTI